MRVRIPPPAPPNPSPGASSHHLHLSPSSQSAVQHEDGASKKPRPVCNATEATVRKHQLRISRRILLGIATTLGWLGAKGEWTSASPSLHFADTFSIPGPHEVTSIEIASDDGNPAIASSPLFSQTTRERSPRSSNEWANPVLGATVLAVVAAASGHHAPSPLTKTLWRFFVVVTSRRRRPQSHQARAARQNRIPPPRYRPDRESPPRSFLPLPETSPAA